MSFYNSVVVVSENNTTGIGLKSQENKLYFIIIII